MSTNNATHELRTLNTPHPAFEGGVYRASPTATQTGDAVLRRAAASNIRDTDGITMDAALAYYDARVGDGRWQVVVLAVPFGRTGINTPPAP